MRLVMVLAGMMLQGLWTWALHSRKQHFWIDCEPASECRTIPDLTLADCEPTGQSLAPV